MIGKQLPVDAGHVLAVVLVLVWLPPSSRSAGFQEPGFYERKAEGWFWYREIPVEEEAEKVPPPALPKSKGQVGSKPFSTAWMKENLPKYREAAIDDPKPENVAAYFALQRLALDKAERFSKVAGMLPVLYPALDENRRRPIANFGAGQADRMAGQGRQSALGEIARRMGIFFFFRSDCPYCHAQAPILQMLERQYGFRVIPVSLDGMPMPGGLYRNFRRNTGQAEALGVKTTPAMFLVNPEADERIRLLGQGALSLGQLERRIVEVAFKAGWIGRNLYEKTLPVKPIYLDDPEITEHGHLPPERILQLLGVTESPKTVERPAR